ncbi:MAG: hypothetical protein CBC72_002475 [Gammaproteobacteria bacterium TMED112]|nr:MAG: hypothetical protein CBC72_002475 [Gammaproteobacteria bacterium TMED112]|tara:strand:+ start:20724 stop:21158 length:435 start_codon:yes stop_codon:yes gene_type:complete
MNKQDLIRFSIFALLLFILLIFYNSIGFLSFTNININDELPKPLATKKTIETTENIGSVETAKKLSLGFELVGIRGNNPQSTIIILDKSKYKLVEQGEEITSQLSFSHVEGSRAYFFDGKDYSFLDIIGSEKSFNQDRIDLIKD